MTNPAKHPFWSLAAAEPYRVFFPLGLLFGVSGVSLWPLYFLGWHRSFYPGVMHARMMIEGFMGAFVLGFLATALPRLLGARQLGRGELYVLLGLFIPAIGLHIGHQHLPGDILFLVLLLLFAALMVPRFRACRNSPPPGFVLVLFGFANSIAGTAFLIASASGDRPAWTMLLGRSLLYEGFILFLLLGIGGFLSPRFLSPIHPATRDEEISSRQWWVGAGLAAATGAVLCATFVADAIWPWFRGTAGVRCATAAAYLFSQIPWGGHAAGATLAHGIKAALLLLLVGLAFPGLWPLQRVAGLHVVFIGGFTLITFAVATRLVLGHSGQGQRLWSRMPFMIFTAALLIVAAGLRFVGDFLHELRNPLLNYGAYAWMLAAAVWSWRVLPWVRRGDPTA